MTDTTERTYRVEGMTCAHCRAAVSDEVSQVTGVADVAVDLDAGTVTVRGAVVDDGAVRAAIDEAGDEVRP